MHRNDHPDGIMPDGASSGDDRARRFILVAATVTVVLFMFVTWGCGRHITRLSYFRRVLRQAPATNVPHETVPMPRGHLDRG
jgi:hypothetical protein